MPLHSVKFKHDVAKVQGITLEGITIIAAAVIVWREIPKTHVTVTSINDGKHSRNSLHYQGRAVDFRIRDDDARVTWEPDIKHFIVRRMRDILGDEYDVVLETTHLHVEYDPR